MNPEETKQPVHAVIVSVTINDADAATNVLRSEIVPQVKQAPGFVAGYWTRIDSDEGSQGRGTIVFESEDAARAAAERIRQPAPGQEVTMNSVEVGEVVANA
jgi:hypothetical protein